jgi:hypothetical protein
VIDEFLPTLEELAGRSKGRIRANAAHEKITGTGMRGPRPPPRRGVAELKRVYAAGRPTGAGIDLDLSRIWGAPVTDGAACPITISSG